VGKTNLNLASLRKIKNKLRKLKKVSEEPAWMSRKKNYK
jgi:hypothetical protein